MWRSMFLEACSSHACMAFIPAPLRKRTHQLCQSRYTAGRAVRVTQSHASRISALVGDELKLRKYRSSSHEERTMYFLSISWDLSLLSNKWLSEKKTSLEIYIAQGYEVSHRPSILGKLHLSIHFLVSCVTVMFQYLMRNWLFYLRMQS